MSNIRAFAPAWTFELQRLISIIHMQHWLWHRVHAFTTGSGTEFIHFALVQKDVEFQIEPMSITQAFSLLLLVGG